MEGLYRSRFDFYKETYRDPGFSSNCDDPLVSEIWSHQPSVITSRRAVRDIVAQPPILSASPSIEYSEENPCLQLRIVWIPYDDDQYTLEISQEDHKLLVTNLQLELAYDYCVATPGGRYFLPVSAADRGKLLICAVNVNIAYGSICWIHDLVAHRTTALCWSSKFFLRRMQALLNYDRSIAQHAMFPALLCARFHEECLDIEIHRELVIVASVENRTKHYKTMIPYCEVAQGSFASLSAKMSGCASTLAGINLGAKIQQSILAAVDAYQTEQKPILASDDFARVSAGVGEYVRVLRERTERIQDETACLSRKSEVQLTALFHLITSKESRTNIAIAQDSRTLAAASKEDSTAMKTLALVTVVFLPGTFVAAFFAVPIFQWDAGVGEQIISRRFWIYWAVTLPLTLMTIIPWVLWTRRKNAAHRLQLKKAREKFAKDVQGLGEDASDEEEVEPKYSSHSPGNSISRTNIHPTFSPARRRGGGSIHRNEDSV